MSATPEEIKRRHLQELFDEVLKEKKIFLIPKFVRCFESTDPPKTITSFGFEERCGSITKSCEFEEVSGKGFVDCIFRTCVNFYSEEYESLKNIELVDLLITPVFSFRVATHASKANVLLKIKVDSRGEFEFKNKSNFIISSSYANILASLEFFINCEKAFRLLRDLTLDAKERNRGDLVSAYSYKLSSLTEMNTYEK